MQQERQKARVGMNLALAFSSNVLKRTDRSDHIPRLGHIARIIIVTLNRAVSFCVFRIGFLQDLNKQHEVYFVEVHFVST